MSNSPLISYIRISPNSTNPRRDKIRKITIHHMAGDMTVEACGNLFTNPARQASSNYGIGTDGRIALYVDEANRAWTSSSPENDNQAITIEVANDGGAPDWHVSDRALESTIALCVDICRRNGITRLSFTGDASGNLTQHNYFAATECPGPYLKGKFAFIADEVNRRLSEEENGMKGILYIGDFTSRVETGMIELFLQRGGHTCEVVPYGEKWGVLVTALADGVTKAELQQALLNFGKIYSTDPKIKK